MFNRKEVRQAALATMALVGLGLGLAGPAKAVPSYARQTGQDCAACHVGSFGPQLTPYGLKFKLGGYTESDGKSGHIPLSAMLVQSFTHTSKDQTEDPASGFSRNDNWSLQEGSIFLAGRITDNIGTFTQVTWSEPDRQWALDNFDVRVVKPLQINDKDTVLGITVNNNPTVQDAFNTVPAWRFPYMATELAPGPNAAPLISGGLEQQVIGASGYGFYDDNWYGELGGYQSLSRAALNDINIEPDAKINGTAPYWRLAYFKDLHTQAWSVGLFGMNADLVPGWTGSTTDKYQDVGLDGSYQFLGDRQNVFTVNGSLIHEHRKLSASYNEGDASKKYGDVNEFDLAASYYFARTYGVTVGLFDIGGTRDDALYDTGEADAGSIKGSPDSRGYILQADWTPFGKEDSWYAPFANLRVGLQYTGYTQFNGASNNYDGLGRDASNNNTLYAFFWFAM